MPLGIASGSCQVSGRCERENGKRLQETTTSSVTSNGVRLVPCLHRTHSTTASLPTAHFFFMAAVCGPAVDGHCPSPPLISSPWPLTMAHSTMPTVCFFLSFFSFVLTRPASHPAVTRTMVTSTWLGYVFISSLICLRARTSFLPPRPHQHR